MSEKETAFVAKTAAVPLRGKAKLKASVLADDKSDWVKVLVQGHTGTGKTRTLAEILKTKNREGKPTRVVVLSTDIGGNGLRTVKQQLRAEGHEDLLKNVAWIELTSYEDFSAVTSNPNCIEIEGKTFWDWNPDVLFWDGFSNFQESLVWRYVLDIESIAKDASEARQEGIQAGLAEYGQIRRVTILQIDAFCQLHNPNGKKLHKLVTVLLDDGKESKLTKELKQGPLVIGAAGDYMGPAFDAIITLRAMQAPGSKVPTYSYSCDVGGKAVAKVRGTLPVEALAKADFQTVWSSLTAVSESKADPVASNG